MEHRGRGNVSLRVYVHLSFDTAIIHGSSLKDVLHSFVTPLVPINIIGWAFKPGAFDQSPTQEREREREDADCGGQMGLKASMLLASKQERGERQREREREREKTCGLYRKSSLQNHGHTDNMP